MRFPTVLLIVMSIASWGRSDQPIFETALLWQPAFGPIPASSAEQALVMLLLTNQDPLPATADPATPISPAWCADVFESSYRQLLERRPDLSDRIVLQSIAVGTPKELTGGQDRNAPARAILALCDADYRLLGFVVGVPQPETLITLVEDGEDVATQRRLHADHPEVAFSLMVQRSDERLNSMWRGALQEMVAAMQDDQGDRSAQPKPTTISAASLQLLGETFAAAYLADVRLRFGLTEGFDAVRLVVLEQHAEVRRPWCQAMMPFVVGSDFRQMWRGLVELVWADAPITAEADVAALLDWFDVQHDSELIVLLLQPPAHRRHLPWPPIADKQQGRAVGWQETHALALQHPFRSIDPEQLAHLIRARQLDPVDIHQPSPARYLVWEPRHKTALVVRESEPPSRFARMLKRSNSKLVKE